MNTKQKLRVSNIINFCFFILVFLFLVTKLIRSNIVVLNAILRTDLLYFSASIVIILFISTILYLLPGLLLIKTVVFITFEPTIFLYKTFNAVSIYIKSNQDIHKRISVCRC